MLNRKFLLGTVLSTAVLLSACSTDEYEETETTTAATTTAAVTTVPSETTETTETSTETEAREYEQGLVFFVQPIIEQYDEYDDWSLAEWQPRDTDVLYGECHYDREWDYRKELIFAFSNYNEYPVTIESIKILNCGQDYKPVSFTNGSDTLNINFTVQPGHKTDYILRAEDFDYSACESGIYRAIVKEENDQYDMEFFIDNSEIYEETFPLLMMPDWVEDPETWIGRENVGIAPTFLTEEQQEIFAKACARMYEFFWYDAYLSEEYVSTHTVDDFVGLFTDVFTEEYARRLIKERYLDENGNLQAYYGGGRGSDITYEGHCFLPVSADEDQITFKAVVIHAHSDVPYKVWFEELEYHMVNTEDGWRVFDFKTWN